MTKIQMLKFKTNKFSWFGDHAVDHPVLNFGF